MIYKFKEGSRLPGNAQIVGERLAQLESHGRLTPKDVVADARPPTSPLHGLFEWDDAAAADQYRLQQAGHLIRSVTVVLDADEVAEEPRMIRAFFPVTSGDDARRQFVDTVRALSDAEIRGQILRQAHAELSALARKYRELRELSDVVQAIDKVGDLLTEGQPH